MAELNYMHSDIQHTNMYQGTKNGVDQNGPLEMTLDFDQLYLSK